MTNTHLILALRNLFLLQFLAILLVPDLAVVVHRQVSRVLRSLNAPFLESRQALRKGSKFWEIDMTKFEP